MNHRKVLVVGFLGTVLGFGLYGMHYYNHRRIEITRERYDRIRLGMPYKEVVEIMGASSGDCREKKKDLAYEVISEEGDARTWSAAWWYDDQALIGVYYDSDYGGVVRKEFKRATKEYLEDPANAIEKRRR